MEEIEDIGRRGITGLIFLQNIKSSLFEELKNCIEGGFEMVYMNSSNLIYVVIIFLKLIIY